MKKFGIGTIALLLIVGNVLAQSDVLHARWQANPVVVDGSDQEWDKPLNFYDDESGLLYAISNNTDSLYFTFAVRDIQKMRKMVSSGWSIQLSAKDKKNKIKASLVFPAVKLELMGNRGADAMPGLMTKENPMIRAYKLQLGTVAVKGFKTDKSEVPLQMQDDINIAVGENHERQLVYEIGIPLEELFGSGFTPGQQVLTLNVMVNAMSRPTNGGNTALGGSGGGGGRPGGGGGGGGMRQGGGMGGGMQGGGKMAGGGQRPGNGSGDRSSAFARTSFKQKFVLAVN